MSEPPETIDCSHYIPCLCCDEFVSDAALGPPSRDPTCSACGAVGMYPQVTKCDTTLC